MKKNEEVETEAIKDKRMKLNKKQKYDNKHEAGEGRKKANEISNAFPNFSILTNEERLALFQALTIARKNVEKRGVVTRKSFGTPHDEYLQYFDQNDQDEEKKQEESRLIKSSPILSENYANSCQFENFSKEEHSRSATLCFQNQLKAPEGSSAIFTVKPKSWDQHEPIIQKDTTKIISLYLKKNKKNEAKAQVEDDRINEINWITKTPSNRSDTPQFNALSKKEKEIFFKTLQKAHENILEKNPGKSCQIVPFDNILKRYQEVTTVFTTTQDTCGFEEKKRNFKITLTVTSKDNESPLLKQSQKESVENESLQETDSSTEGADEDECSRLERPAINQAENDAEEDSECETPETGWEQKTIAPNEFLQDECDSPSDEEVKFCEDQENSDSEKNLTKPEECQENVRMCLNENVQEGIQEKTADAQFDETCEEIKRQEMIMEEFEKKEIVKNVCECQEENLRTPVEDESGREQKPEVPTREVKEIPEQTRIQEVTLNRMMLVDDDVITKLKTLIYYLEAKTNADPHLEKKYLKLLVDYTGYLSKIMEHLILRKEKKQKQQRNTCVASGFLDDFNNTKKMKFTEPESLLGSMSAPIFGKKQPSDTRTEETSIESDLNLPILPDSDSTSGSEGEGRFMYAGNEKRGVLTTKIRHIHDLLRDKAEFRQGNFSDVKIINLPGKVFVLGEEPPKVRLLTNEGKRNHKRKNKMKFFKGLVSCCTYKRKKTPEAAENLKKKVRTVVAEDKKKGETSELIYLETLTATDRKKIVDKYFT